MDILPALREISELLEQNGLRWCLRGSVERLVKYNQASENNDIDINTDKEGFAKIQKLFTGRLSRKYDADVLEAIVLSVPVEIMSFDELEKNAAYQRKKTMYDGVTLYVSEKS